jgi:hypothetical protein
MPTSDVEQTKRNEGFIFIYTPLGTLLKEVSKEASMCASSKKVF